ncbi:hypothetical protein [Rhizobium sp. LjRoot258]|uniref:hypothetical protein n=1 Tax=Rhizobium sp. LjRoot258 TaxID=3342299 RepID=UPI003ECF654A
MIDKVAPTSSVSPSSVAHANHSTSIASEPDMALIAERQAQITAGFERMKEEREVANGAEGQDRASERHTNGLAAHVHPREGNTEEQRLSGESVRIGTGNLDDDVPFGKHIGFV